MARSRTRLLMCATVLGLVSALILAGCEVSPGSIAGYSFPEGVTVEIAAGIDIYSILIIDPPVDGQSIIVTDQDGYFHLTGVNPGVYVLTPLYASTIGP